MRGGGQEHEKLSRVDLVDFGPLPLLSVAIATFSSGQDQLGRVKAGSVLWRDHVFSAVGWGGPSCWVACRSEDGILGVQCG